MIECLNCTTRFEGKFCSECGQKAATHRFSMHEWRHEIPHSIFHVDHGFFHTLKNLFRRPGLMIREYLSGRRKEYFSPFLYVLIWCGVFVVVSHLFADDAAKKSIEINSIQSATAYLQDKYYKLIIVAMIVPTALATRLVFLRSGYNFAEHLVLNAFLIGQLIIADIIIALVAQNHFIKERKSIVAGLDMLLKFPFWIWTYWQFFRPKNVFVGLMQIILAIVLGSVFATLLIFGAGFVYLMVKGGASVGGIGAH